MNYIKDFFKPQVFRYRIKIPKLIVYKQLKEAIPTNTPLWSSSDLIGQVNQDSFALKLASPIYIRGANFSSNLNGTILESENDITEIEISIERNPATYGLFFFFIALFIIFFCAFCILPNSFKFLFWSLITLVGGTLFCIGISNASCKTLKERFDNLIYKTLKKH